MPTRGRGPSEGTTLDRLTAARRGSDKHGRARAGEAGVDPAGREGGQVTEMQRRRLLLAFAEVLAERGLEDARVGRICSRAGVSRRTFYDLFEDREACFLALVDSAVGRISQSVVPLYRGEDRGLNGRSSGVSAKWCVRVRGALSVLLEFFEEEPVLARVLLVETLKAGPVVAERRRRVLDVLTSVVEEGRFESKKGAEPPPLTGQSTVGGAISVVHARLIEANRRPLVELLNPLMSMIVYPYLGPAAARRELTCPVRSPKLVDNGQLSSHARDPFKDLPIRITFRTARVLAAISARPGASNRQIADVAEVADQGQMSKLLNRLRRHGLVENDGPGQAKGEPNAWTLTQRGHDIQHAIGSSNNL